MDNLVLIRVSAALDRSFSRLVLREFRQETDHRFRLVFDRDGRPASVVVSLGPPGPWIGRPARSRAVSRRPPAPFAARCDQELRQTVLDGVSKGADRTVTLRFADGGRIVAELVPNGANLILVDGEGRTRACARRPRAGREDLAPGAVYGPPEAPVNRLDPLAATASDIDARIERETREGAGPRQALSGGLFGISAATARIVLEESAGSGRSAGHVLAERVAALTDGTADPVLEGLDSTLPPALEGKQEPEGWRLFPWEPPGAPEAPLIRIRLDDAAATAGLYYSALESRREGETRGRGLLRILASEIARGRRAESRIASDLAGFEDPDRFRFQAEALLAGLRVARRSGDHVLVPDPYDASGQLLSVPVPGHQTLQQGAEALFKRHRRARRGLDQARHRAEGVAARRRRLEGLQAGFTDPADAGSASELERAMRKEGIAVGLEPPRGRRAPVAPPSRPRLEGIRLFEGPEGEPILVGKGGKENDRLTFKLAGPEDFWFHALGVPGAHVVVRNERRESRPARDLLRRAAALAAFYSDSRNQPQVDVQWTRRKYVRRFKGAAPGTVKVKKSETIRVRPRASVERRERP